MTPVGEIQVVGDKYALTANLSVINPIRYGRGSGPPHRGEVLAVNYLIHGTTSLLDHVRSASIEFGQCYCDVMQRLILT